MDFKKENGTMTRLMSSIILTLLFFFCSNNIAFCQAMKIAYYTSYSKTDSITIPIDYIGPKYHNYVEGSIIYFDFKDSSKILILCGADAMISPDSSYSITDSLTVKNRVISYRYFSKSKNKFSRQDFLPDYSILYQDVSLNRLKEFDKSLDILKNR